jgi:uncharacterized protein (DUF488 family)
VSPEDAAQLGARLVSVGHSLHSIEKFVDLLRKEGVTAVADVRTSPYSRRLPQFNRHDLEAALRTSEIAYVFLGDQLGGRPQSAELYDERGVVDYERVRRTAAFREGLRRLLEKARQGTVAMLCAEDDPLDCHRGLMITPALVELGVAPRHLRRDRTVETTTEMEDRLLRETKLTGRLLPDLFTPAPDRNEVLAEAYRVRAGKKAYRLEDDSAERP